MSHIYDLNDLKIENKCLCNVKEERKAVKYCMVFALYLLSFYFILNKKQIFLRLIYELKV